MKNNIYEILMASSRGEISWREVLKKLSLKNYQEYAALMEKMHIPEYTPDISQVNMAAVKNLSEKLAGSIIKNGHES